MTEANSLARVAFFHQQLKEKASLKRHCVAFFSSPLPLPTVHCLSPSGRIFSLTSPSDRKQQKEELAFCLTPPASSTQSSSSSSILLFQQCLSLSLPLTSSRYFVLLHTFHLVFFHCEMQPAEAAVVKTANFNTEEEAKARFHLPIYLFGIATTIKSLKTQQHHVRHLLQSPPNFQFTP